MQAYPFKFCKHARGSKADMQDMTVLMLLSVPTDRKERFNEHISIVMPSSLII